MTRIPGGDDRLSIHNEAVRWLTWSVEVAVVLADLHSKAEFDLIDFAEWGGEGYVHLLNRVPWSYTPTVIQLHGPLVTFAHTMGWPDVDSEFYRVGTHMEETCLRLADGVFSSSHCSIEWCARHYGLDPAAAPVLHTGVDVDLFKPRKDVSRTHPTIVFVGKFVKNKGVDLLVDAAIQLRKQFPDLQLWLVGRGEPTFVRGLQERVDSVGAAGLLQMKGFVERERLAELLRCAHVFAAPAVYEGGPGFVYLEAMACGLPVIACGGSGASEVIQPGVTGLLVPPRGSRALAGSPGSPAVGSGDAGGHGGTRPGLYPARGGQPGLSPTDRGVLSAGSIRLSGGGLPDVNATITTRVVNDFRACDAGWWSGLLASGETDNVFLTHPWQSAWWQTFGRGRLLLVVAEAGGRPLALSPLFWDSGMIFFTGSGGSDYLGFVGDCREPGVLEALLDTARRHVPQFLGFRFYHLPEHSDTGTQLQQAAPQLGMVCYEEGELTAPALCFDRWPKGQRPPADKTSLVRHERRFRRQGQLDVVHFRRPEEIRPQLEGFFEQHVKRWEPTSSPSLFRDQRQREFYLRVTNALGPQGWLRFTRVEWNARPVAFHFGTCYRGTSLWYKPSFDIELARLSPGEVLLRQLLRAAVAEGAHITAGTRKGTRRVSNRRSGWPACRGPRMSNWS